MAIKTTNYKLVGELFVDIEVVETGEVGKEFGEGIVKDCDEGRAV